MPTREELLKAIADVSKLPDTYSKCQKLATFYILLSSLYPDEENKNDMSTQFQNTIPEFGSSEFLQRIKGHDMGSVFSILDELMDAVKVFNPKLYNNTMQKL